MGLLAILKPSSWFNAAAEPAPAPVAVKMPVRNEGHDYYIRAAMQSAIATVAFGERPGLAADQQVVAPEKIAITKSIREEWFKKADHVVADRLAAPPGIMNPIFDAELPVVYGGMKPAEKRSVFDKVLAESIPSRHYRLEG